MTSVRGFSEGIILSLAFVAILSIVIGGMNHDYGKNYNIGFSDSSNTEQLFINFNEQAQTQIQGGEAQFDAQQGITVKSSWGIAKDAVSVTWSFLSGNWIEQTINVWGLGESGTVLAKAIRIVYITALIFALLYVLFKVGL